MKRVLGPHAESLAVTGQTRILISYIARRRGRNPLQMVSRAWRIPDYLIDYQDFLLQFCTAWNLPL